MRPAGLRWVSILPVGQRAMRLSLNRALTEEDGPMRIVFVASAMPRRCGIATFTGDLIQAVKSADPTVRTRQVAIDEPNAARAYGPEVRWRVRQEDWRTYRDAALAINETSADIVNIQHE